MWSLFHREPLLSEVDRLFQIECYKWLLKHFGGDAFYNYAQLILPTKDFFPDKVSSQRKAAETTFQQVKKYAGMEEWPCKLVVQKADINRVVAPTIVIQDVDQSPSGTFSATKSNKAIISYNPDIVSDPVQMVATFAHELAHYLTSAAPEPPPGGWDNWEFATDIAATFLGFGIFLGNSAFNFRQYSSVESQGWQSTRGGYLSEAEYGFALAIFMCLKGIPFSAAAPYCDANIKSFLKRSLVEIKESNIIDELRKVEFVQYAT